MKPLLPPVTALAVCLGLAAHAAPTDAPIADSNPQLLTTLTNALRTEGLPTRGAAKLTRGEALHLLNTLHGGDDLVRAPVVSRVKRVLEEAARR